MTLREHFFSLSQEAIARSIAGEVLLCGLRGEDSNYVRLNQNRVRQAGHVRQLEFFLQAIMGRRHASAQCTLCGELKTDRERLLELLSELRAQRDILEEDPYLLYATEVRSSERIASEAPLDAPAAITAITEAAEGLDLVGLFASSLIYRGFANSLGQRNWFERPSFVFDWSCYAHGDKAVKSRYAGVQWDPEAMQRKMQAARQDLAFLQRPPRKIRPGNYRAYLAPTAVAELLEITAWGGFGLKSQRTRQSPLIKLADGLKALDPRVQMVENYEQGVAPGFTSGGFIKPPAVPLITAGRLGSSLVSARSSQEYGVAVNAEHESPESLDLAPGHLSATDVLARLDTGLYINNLWYCNFSDRNDWRITGMTRFACFWVEGGEIKQPLEVMRFDDSLYLLLGERLLGLTQERDFILDGSTYHQRSAASMRLPGVLVEDLNLTL
ncbi:MAG: metallopeptidase TldD-related protein [Gammaproteobacteria bacterium]